MDNKKKKLLWLAIIILVVIGVIILGLSLFKDKTVSPEESDLTTDNQPKFPVVSVPKDQIAKIKPEENAEFTVNNLAKAFVDRYGSWSTDNQGQNLGELSALSSARMKNYLESIELTYDPSQFFGVTTKTLSVDIISLDEANGEAKLEISAQRTETKNDFSENIYYQKGKIELIKSGDNWLVDYFSWQ